MTRAMRLRVRERPALQLRSSRRESHRRSRRRQPTLCRSLRASLPVSMMSQWCVRRSNKTVDLMSGISDTISGVANEVLGLDPRKRDILAKAAGWFARESKANPNGFTVHERPPGPSPIRTTARILKVLASGYCAWLGRPASARATADADLTQRIRTIHAGSRATCARAFLCRS